MHTGQRGSAGKGRGEEWELATGFAELREASRGGGGEDNSHTLVVASVSFCLQCS